MPSVEKNFGQIGIGRVEQCSTHENHEGLTFTSPFSPVQPLTYVQQNLEGGHRDTQWPFHKVIHVDTENKVFEHNYIIEYKISEEYQSYWFIPYDMGIDDRGKIVYYKCMSKTAIMHYNVNVNAILPQIVMISPFLKPHMPILSFKGINPGDGAGLRCSQLQISLGVASWNKNVLIAVPVPVPGKLIKTKLVRTQFNALHHLAEEEPERESLAS
ncbi:hypothetical protein OUZ56_012644 [Daphnia magna]|uniref:Uncharacterized protein n=1 Tax=Daphnia magna TaxID=35525 RepID=A0ABQ9Z3M7_9CRUS|nr:hypothetical protein OUZ56_012644 [Daphnia magna]